MKNLLAKFNPKMLRFRLLTGYVLMVLIAAVGISAGTFYLGVENARAQTVNQLTSVSQQKILMVDAWKTRLQSELYAALSEEYALDRIQSLLQLDQYERYSTYFASAVRVRLNGYVMNSIHIHEIFLLDREGNVILSTNIDREGENYYFDPFYMRGIEKPALQLVIPEESEVIQEAVIAIPIINPEGSLLGVMAGRCNLLELAAILADTTSLGSTGNTYLIIDGTTILMVEGKQPALSELQAISLQSDVPYVDAGKTFSSGSYTSFERNDVIGVLQWLPTIQSVLVVEQNNREVFRSTMDTLKINILIALVAVFIAVAASILNVQRIIHPIDHLVQTTSQVAAGDLSQMVKVNGEDEISALAHSFNLMTLQLGELIENLEKKVEVRTRTLEHRAIQLQTILDVNRQITSILNIDTLLANITHLIHEAFPPYTAFIFLVDRETGSLNLRAASSPSENIGLDVENRLRQFITKDLLEGSHFTETCFQEIGFLPPQDAAGRGQPILAIPLHFGGKLTGIMAIHSSDETSLTQEDVLVIQNLAEQIAIAIENAHRYDHIQHIAVIEERNRLARDMHDSVIQSLYSFGLLIEGWRMMLQSGSLNNFEEILERSKEINQQALKEMRLLIHELRPPQLQQLGLWGALIQRLESVEKRMGIDIQLDVQEFIDLPPDIEAAVYRISQEALNNALKHAEASSIVIRCETFGQEFILEIKDNGKGFRMEATDLSGRLGIKNMSERARQAGGTLEVQSIPGQGTTVRLCLPLRLLQ